MILSLLRVKEFSMEDMMKSSFAEFHAQKQHPDMKKALNDATQRLQQLKDRPWPEGPGR
jgi:superfamily II RNA helicase